MVLDRSATTAGLYQTFLNIKFMAFCFNKNNLLPIFFRSTITFYIAYTFHCDEEYQLPIFLFCTFFSPDFIE